MTRRRKWLLVVGIAAALAVALGLLVLWSLGTQSGARWVVARLEAILPGRLEIAEMEGPIRGPLTLHGVHWENERLDVFIADVYLDWRLRRLLRRQLDIGELRASGVRVLRTPSDEKTPLPDLNLRFNVILREALVEDVVVRKRGEPEDQALVIDRVVVDTADLGNDHLRLDELAVASPMLDAEVTGNLHPVGDYAVDLQAVWAYRGADLPELRGHGTLTGSLEELGIRQEITAPFPATIEGTLLQPLYDLRLDLDARFRELDPRLFAEDVPVTRAAGLVGLEGSLDAWAAAGRLDLATTDYGPVDATFALERLAAEDLWRIERLRMTRPNGPMTVAASGTIGGDSSRLDLALAWEDLAWPLVGDPTLRSATGEGAVSGTLDDYRFRIEGQLASDTIPEGRWRLEGRGDRESARAPEVRGRILGGTITGQAAVAWKPEVRWSAIVTASNVAIEELAPTVPAAMGDGTWHARLVGDGEGMRFTNLRAQVLGGGITGSGAVAWSPDLSYRAELVARGLDLTALFASAPETLGRGTWRVDLAGDGDAVALRSVEAETFGGTLQGSGRIGWEPELTYALELEATGISPRELVPSLPEELGAGSAWQASVRGDAEGLALEPLQGRFLGGDVLARGRVSWDPRLAWDLSVHGTGVDPGVAFPDWTGDLDLAATTTGVMTDDGPEGRVEISRATGSLRGLPFQGGGTVILAGGTQRFEGVQATWGESRLAATGQIGDLSDLRFELEQVDVGALLPMDVEGTFAGTGRLTGPLSAPRIEADLAGEEVRYAGISAATVAGQVDIDLAPGGRFFADLRGAGVAYGDRSARSFALELEGERERHTFTATLEAEEAELTIAARGGLGPESVWRGELTRLDLDGRQVGSWELVAPTSVVASASRVAVDELCWASGNAELCAGGTWVADGPVDAQARLDDIPLGLVAPLLPPEMRVSGEIDGNLVLGSTPNGVLVGELELRPSPGTAIWSTERGDEARLALEGGDVLVRLAPDGVVADLDLTLERSGRLVARAELPAYRIGAPLDPQAVQATVEARFADLGFLQTVVPSLESTRGRLTARLAIGGTVGSPSVTGSAHLEEGAASVPALGLDLGALDVTVTSDGTPGLAVDGRGRAGEGTFTVAGTIPPSLSAETPIRLHLTGDGVTVMDTADGRIVADPDLEIVHTGERLAVTGDVVVPEATLTFGERDPGMVNVSPDVVYVGSPPATAAAPGLGIDARVRVVLGDDVRFEGLGLETRLEGSILVIDEPDRPTRARGDLQLVEGTYQAYGQDLVIDRGRLVFAGGPVTNPGLSIRAYRRIDEEDVVAGIRLFGTLAAPEIEVWSEPDMPESDALSYILFGRPLAIGTGGGEDGDLLTRAATGLGVGGANLLTARLAEELGLEEATIETEGAIEEAQLVLGKYISPRLFIGYGIGLFDPISTFRIRYLINDKWTLQAETGEAPSGDLLYTVERGGQAPEEGAGLDSPDSMEELTPPGTPAEGVDEGAPPLETDADGDGDGAATPRRGG